MISKRRKLSWIIMAVFIVSMVLPGFVQPTQAVDPISPVSITLGEKTADGAVQVAVDTPLIATFSETVTLLLNYETRITVQYSADGVNYSEPLSGISVAPVTDGQGNFTNQISIANTGTPWGANLFYRVVVDSGAIVGEVSGATNTPFTVNFQTVDTIPPEILGSDKTTPQDGDNNVPLTILITATYPEDVTEGPNIGNITMAEIHHDTGNIPVPITYSTTDNILTISVDSSYALINSTTYMVTIPAGAVQDKVGNLQQNPRSFYFTTIAAATGGGSGGSDFDGTISGTVTDESSQPLMGITVMALKVGDLENQIKAETGEDGTYSIAVPSGIDYYVIAYPSNFEQQPYARTFYPGPNGEASVIMERSTTVTPQPNVTEINFVLKPGGSISGSITDNNQNPLTNITVKCQQQTNDGSGWYDWTTTDGSGNYILTGLPFGTYTITAPTDINKSYKDLFWQETPLNQSVTISLETRNISAPSLPLSPIDHPVVTDIWPKWIATGTTEGRISLNGAGLNTLGENPVLKITTKGTDNSDVVVAESNEINFDPKGAWLNAKVHSIDAAGLTPAEIYYGSLLLTDNNNTVTEFVCNNWIGITSQPLIYGNVDPWAISSSKDSVTLKLYGANLTSLGTEPIQVYMANKENPQQIYFGTAQAAENNDGSQYLEVTFNFTDPAPKPTPGSYFIAANNPPVTIHGMVDEVDVNDTSAAVEVVNFPAVTNVILQADNTLLVEGVNFNQFADMGKVAGVISDPDNPATIYPQPVNRINDMELQVALPANIITNNSYIFDLYDNAGTPSVQWIRESRWFYLPGTDAQVQGVNMDPNHLDSNYSATEINVSQESQQAWKANDTLIVSIFRQGSTDPVTGFTGLPIAGTVTDTGFTFTLPAGLAQGVYFAEISRDSQTIAQSRLQIGQPSVSPDTTMLIFDLPTMMIGYNPVNITVSQEDSAFWHAGDELTLNIMQQTGNGLAPANLAPISITGNATNFAFTLNPGLTMGDYIVLIKRGDEILTGAPFKIVLDTNFTDSDTDHAYFNGNNFSVSINIPGLENLPPQAEFTASMGILTTFGSSEMDTSKSVFVVEPVLTRSGSTFTVSGTINNPGNNTLAAGLMGMLLQPPSQPGDPKSPPIGPIPIIDTTGKPALVGIRIPDGAITAAPALSEITDLYDTKQAIIFTRTDPTNSEVMGSIAFPEGLNIIDNHNQLNALNNAIQIVAQTTPTAQFYVEVDTGSMKFLRGKNATVTIHNIPYTELNKVKIVCNDPSGLATNLQLQNGTLTFNVNHFSRYTVQEAASPLSGEARLSDLKIGDSTISGFNPDTYSYNIELPAETTVVPSLSYTLYDSKANAVITNASSLPGSSTIKVTAEDGTQKTYTINFTVTGASTDNCFIATAAYGSKFQPSVALLRQFRDHFLMTNDFGRAFVAFYYKNSPPIASYIAGNESLKAIVRLLLTPAVGVAYLMLHPGLTYPLLLILFAAAVLWRMKQKKYRFKQN